MYGLTDLLLFYFFSVTCFGVFPICGEWSYFSGNVALLVSWWVCIFQIGFGVSAVYKKALGLTAVVSIIVNFKQYFCCENAICFSYFCQHRTLTF
jgi:hypothetical protein